MPLETHFIWGLALGIMIGLLPYLATKDDDKDGFQ